MMIYDLIKSCHKQHDSLNAQFMVCNFYQELGLDLHNMVKHFTIDDVITSQPPVAQGLTSSTSDLTQPAEPPLWYMVMHCSNSR